MDKFLCFVSSSAFPGSTRAQHRRIGLGNYWRSHHARHHDSVRHRFGAAVSFRSVHLRSFLLITAGDAFRETSWQDFRETRVMRLSEFFRYHEFHNQDFKVRVDGRWMLSRLL